MRKIRIGNDLAVQWSLVAKGTGEPFVVEGKDIRLSLKSIFATTEIKDFTAQGNTIAWTFKGAEQKQTGIYSLVVSVVDAQGTMVTTDVCQFVELVACSCEADGADEAGVHTESIELVSDVDVAAGIDLSKYLTKTEAQTTYQPQEKGKGLSTNDYTTAEKNKLAGLQNYDDTSFRAEVSETYLPREEFNEVSERFASADRVQELSENVTELSAEVGGLSERIDKLPTAESSVFEAVYGETTYNEIIEAHNEGKIVICEYDVWVCRLTKIQATQVMLQASADNSVTRLTCNTKGQWSVGTSSTLHNLKQLDNGNVEITINTKTAEVATPQYVENLLGIIINGDY
jgi:hypothetical protein